MDGIAQTDTTKTEGGVIETAQPTAGVNPTPVVDNPAPATENPAVEEHTDTSTENGTTEGPAPEEQPSEEPAREMNAEQFEKYNETLRRVSKTAKAGLETRYNAFEDAEVKAAVKKAVMAGETPDIKAIAASVIEKRTQPPAPTPAAVTETIESTDASNELKSLKVENALLKAGIKSDRLEAATKLFIAEGADPSTAAEWVKKYPEWGNQEGGITFTQAPPVAGKTAPTPNDQPPLNDFDKKVKAARIARGLDN